MASRPHTLTAARARNGHLHAALATSEGTARPERGTTRAPGRLALPVAFASIVRRYLLLVAPTLGRELAHWRARAAEIPDEDLRATAERALAKQGNIEGAALFATLAPPHCRRTAVRALVAYQSAYNYLDAVAELPSDAPALNADQLHRALLTALDPAASHPDYYARNPERNDGGYLQAMLEACRGALGSLPSFRRLSPAMRAAAARIVDFQVLTAEDVPLTRAALERWAVEITPEGSDLRWWETAAAAGSSLAVHALIAAAARPSCEAREAAAIDKAYFPYVTALHSLLDSLVDRAEDRAEGRRCLLDGYRSAGHAATRLATLATRAREAMARLESPDSHRVIMTAMCSYYLSAPECNTAESEAVAHALASVLGPPLEVALALFRSKRLVHALSNPGYS